MERVAPPGGFSRGQVEPEARSVQQISHEGRQITFSWFDPPFSPEPPDTNQAYGICLTESGMIVLGACDIDGERYLNLLGGGVEPGETLEDCLVREVMEEGCARVVESRYIGCQRVDDPGNPIRSWRHYQSRFWARVELLPWDPQPGRARQAQDARSARSCFAPRPALARRLRPEACFYSTRLP